VRSSVDRRSHNTSQKKKKEEVPVHVKAEEVKIQDAHCFPPCPCCRAPPVRPYAWCFFFIIYVI
jgi:hypothetical protein